MAPTPGAARDNISTGQQQESATMPEGILPDQNVEILLRLAGATLALLEWHTINDKGKCRLRRCIRARWVPWRPRRTCPGVLHDPLLDGTTAADREEDGKKVIRRPSSAAQWLGPSVQCSSFLASANVMRLGRRSARAI